MDVVLVVEDALSQSVMEKLLIHTVRGYVVRRAINERGVDKIRFFR